MRSRIRIPENKNKGRAALFFMRSEKISAVTDALGSIGISCFVPPEENYGGKLYSLLNLEGFPKTENVPKPDGILSDELIIFIDTADADSDKALEVLRERNIKVRFKAVLTDYNKKFTLPELMVHMFNEELELKNMI